MTTVLGIDPGSVKTGFGIVRATDSGIEYIASGCIRLPKAEIPERLKIIFEDVSELVETYRPEQMAVEQVFLAKNANSALKLGHARGAAIVAGVSHGLTVAEYSARQIKQSVVGTGSATKEQVQEMVKMLLNLPDTPQEDAADALAAALCHIHTSQSVGGIEGVSSVRRGRWR